MKNSIQISNGGNINNIVGGHAQDHTNLNTINITGGTIQSVTGGNSGVVASQNYVNVSGGVVENYIIGGKSYSGSATKNSVIVSTDTSAIIIGGQGTNANAIKIRLQYLAERLLIVYTEVNPQTAMPIKTRLLYLEITLQLPIKSMAVKV
ncbi:hypothetical protein IXZ16_02535 [Campylobacter fetus subsp. fetus]|nr:hypothetical protein IXZ16_02535 [Campylobacter fetus subsp. fetus]